MSSDDVAVVIRLGQRDLNAMMMQDPMLISENDTFLFFPSALAMDMSGNRVENISLVEPTQVVCRRSYDIVCWQSPCLKQSVCSQLIVRNLFE